LSYRLVTFDDFYWRFKPVLSYSKPHTLSTLIGEEKYPKPFWFQSYLSGRLQTINISGASSTSREITCGVPQGTILGPLLFLTYVNDMSAVVKNKLFLYADVSAILVSGKNKEHITSALSKDLELVSHWLVDNKLSLHLGKTESILLGSKPKLKK